MAKPEDFITPQPVIMITAFLQASKQWLLFKLCQLASDQYRSASYVAIFDHLQDDPRSPTGGELADHPLRYLQVDGNMCCFISETAFVTGPKGLSHSYLDEVDVILSAGQLCDLVVSDLMGQTLHVALGIVECRSLVGGDELGHLLLHPLDGAHHVGKHLLAFLQRGVG
ncbi:hypothetical protein EYF80_025025 [Liparis tanakae]|uniref:Uncharacterized protein n=1 Tax=Liparis tanakae TaxID=230148 RepID=A0A4Z2HFU0_9TELE|nr:hypothetical protein EYF80_025025 [Liparis tanakae]